MMKTSTVISMKPYFINYPFKKLNYLYLEFPVVKEV